MRPELSRRLEWRRGDVLRESTGGPWDMILCRNLAIYLEDAVVRALWNRLADALVPGGILVTGRAEKPARTDLVRLSPCSYQKLPLPAP